MRTFILTAFFGLAFRALAADWGCKTELCDPGDTCDSFAMKHGLTLDQLVAFNPQLGSLKDCSTNLVAWNVYCVSPKDGSSPASQASNRPSSQPAHSQPVSEPASQPASEPPSKPSTQASAPQQPQTTSQPSLSASAGVSQPPSTVYVTTTSVSKAPPSTVTITLPPLTITTCVPPPPDTICATNDCWRAFHAANPPLAQPSQSTWCSSVLNANPPMTGDLYNDYFWPGIPVAVKVQCPKMNIAADIVISSYCRCYNSGQMQVGKLTTTYTDK